MPIRPDALKPRRPSWAVPAAIWTLLVMVVLVAGLHQRRSERLQVALARARDGFRKDLILRHWVSERGGIYVPLDERTPANPHLAGPERDLTATDGRRFTLVNPAYLTRMLHELGNRDFGLRGHITSLDPLRPGNSPDPWERETLLRFEAGAREHWGLVEEGGMPALRYMGAFLVQEGCLRCHATQGYHLGDVRGGISVTVPLKDPLLEEGPRGWVPLLGLGLLWALGLAGLLAWTRRTGQLEAERSQSLDDLLESRALYQSLAETLPFSLFRRDPSGRFQYANPYTLRSLGRTAEDCLGRPLEEVYDPATATTLRASDGRALAGEVFSDIAEFRVPATGEVQVNEVIKFPIRDRDGRVVGVQGVAWDVTERILGERRLAEREAMFRAVLEQAPIPMAVHREGRFVFLNTAALRALGAERPEQLLGTPVADRVPPETRAAFVQRQRTVEAGLEVPPLVWSPVRLDGREVVLESRPMMIRFMDGDAVLILSRDITQERRDAEERRRLESEVQHMHRLEGLGRLASGVAHDMNNVLAAIMAIASLMQMKGGNDPALAKDADDLMKATVRGRDLVRGLTQFARKDLQEAVQVDLNALVREEADLLRRTTLKSVEVDLDLEEPLPPVRGEANVLANALMNLCVNALDAMGGRGRLRLSTRVTGPGKVELTVADDGEGMPPEVAARALEPFFTTKPAGKGTGLGLSMVYGAVTAHGGTMEIQSSPGEGTQVHLRFPAGGDAAAPSRPAAAEPAGTGPLEVLLVDDDALVLAGLQSLLESLGHQVATATSGAEALRRLEAGLPADLVVLDLNMPGMDGLETLVRLRPRRPSLPVLLATGHGTRTDLEAALARLAPAAYLAKPFSHAELAAALAALAPGA